MSWTAQWTRRVSLHKHHETYRMRDRRTHREDVAKEIVAMAEQRKRLSERRVLEARA